MKPKDSLPIISVAKEKPLNKLQDQFNKKILKIKQLKKNIDTLKLNIEYAKTQYFSVILPLVEQVIEEDEQFVLFLDHAYQNLLLSAKEKEVIKSLLLNNLFSLIVDNEKEHLIALYDKYADRSFADVMAAMNNEGNERAAKMAKVVFGLDLDPEEFENKEDIERKIREYLEEKEQVDELRKQQRKKTKKQIEKETIKEVEQNQLNKTSRMIYTSLVKELHPDKEPDEQEKLRKTELMKRITSAYEADDFFTLLQIQLEIQVVDNEHFERLNDEQLKFYNKLLQDQVTELQSIYQSLENPPPFVLDEIPYAEYVSLSQKQVEYRLKREQQDLTIELMEKREDLNRFKKSTKDFKDFLKGIKKGMQKTNKNSNGSFV